MRSGRYAAVLRTPGAAPLVGFGFLARLPDGMLNLAILLAVSRSISLAVGGVAAGAYSAASALGSPLRGRWLDRRGASSVVLASGLGQTALVAGLAVAVHTNSRAAVLIVAALAGLLSPPLVAAVRGVWMRVLDSEETQATASALESVIGESVYLGGTVIAGTLGGAAPPIVVLLVAAGLRVIGCVGFAMSPLPRRWPGRTTQHGEPHAKALASRTLQILIAVNVIGFAGFGAVDVAVTHFTAVRDQAAYVGLLLAGYAIGSIAGGLYQGAHTWRWSLERQLVVLLAAAAALLVPVAVVTTTPLLFIALLVAGLPVSPSATVGFLLVGRDAPPGADAEAYTWLTAASFVGLAVGTSVGGATGHAFWVAVAFAAVAALSALALRPQQRRHAGEMRSRPG